MLRYAFLLLLSGCILPAPQPERPLPPVPMVEPAVEEIPKCNGLIFEDADKSRVGFMCCIVETDPIVLYLCQKVAEYEPEPEPEPEPTIPSRRL